MQPPPYPRIPRLSPPTGDTQRVADRFLTDADRGAFLERKVRVEEKLDGANVVIYRDDEGRLTAVGRSGPTGADRAGQFGRLRAWVADRTETLDGLRAEEFVYCEWLYLRHTIHYDRLPGLLIVLDVYRAGGFVSSAERDGLAADFGLPVPPLVHVGVLGSEQKLQELVTQSAFGPELVEGFVLRLELPHEPPRLAKWIRPGFVQKDDDEWTGDKNSTRKLA